MPKKNEPRATHEAMLWAAASRGAPPTGLSATTRKPANESAGSSEAMRAAGSPRSPPRRPALTRTRPVANPPTPKHRHVVVNSHAVGWPTPPARLHEIPVFHGSPESPIAVAVDQNAATTVTSAA